jgi:predicted nucleotidyltransferase
MEATPIIVNSRLLRPIQRIEGLLIEIEKTLGAANDKECFHFVNAYIIVAFMDASPNGNSLRDRLESFCRRHHVEILYVFGSRAGEIHRAMEADGALETGALSDVDFAAKLPVNRRISVREKVELAVEMENLLGVDRVDLVLLSEADPFLAANIIRGERLFCKDAYAADLYELYVLRRAGDLERFERTRIEGILDPQGVG